MQIYVGADHRGYELKEVIKKHLKTEGYEVIDVGNREFDPEDDAVDYAIKVAEMIEGSEKDDKGVLFCGSGHEMDMTANKFPGVRAILGFNDEVVRMGREHDGANILVLPSDWIDEAEVISRVEIFLTTEVNNNEKYERRRKKIDNIKAL